MHSTTVVDREQVQICVSMRAYPCTFSWLSIEIRLDLWQLSPPMPLGAGRMSSDSTRESAGSGYAASRQDGREGRVISHVLEA